MMPTTPSDETVQSILRRASDPAAYARFVAQGEACGWCRQPVRLIGTVAATDPSSGRRTIVFRSADQPDGVLLKPCGTRRATRCPACAAIYKGDARRIIATGLTTGRPADAGSGLHPAVFVTLTAPSFGRVHGMRHRDGGHGPCTPAADATPCPHGRPQSCWIAHQADDPLLGEPLCADCYDYDGSIVWNALVGELWRRTTIYLGRTLARLAGTTARELDQQVRLSYAKVVEYQRRGVVHVHAVVRLDGPDGGLSPAGCDAGLLALAVRVATARVSAPHKATGRTARWGEQADVRVLGDSEADGIAGGAVANYIAKYATKSVDESGVLDRRIRSDADLEDRPLPPHLRRLAATAWELGREPELHDLRLRLWAHDLGYRGHWLTKSRSWSTTFRALREERRLWRLDEARRAQPDAPQWQGPATVTARWRFDGIGWSTPGDAYLAESARRRRDAARSLAREDAQMREQGR
jgi:hypothetical protein